MENTRSESNEKNLASLRVDEILWNILSNKDWIRISKNLLHRIGDRETIMLCELLSLDHYWKEKKGSRFDGWFPAPHDFLYRQTAQLKNMQARTIGSLEKQDLIVKRLKGIPPVNQYKINHENVLKKLLERSPYMEKQVEEETGKTEEFQNFPEMGKSISPNAEKPLNFPEMGKSIASFRCSNLPEMGKLNYPKWGKHHYKESINNEFNNTYILPAGDRAHDTNESSISGEEHSKNGNGTTHEMNKKEKETNPARSIGTRLTRGKASECFLGFGKLLSKVNNTPDLKGAQNFWKIAVPLGTFVVEQRIDESRVKTLISWLFDHYSDPFVPEFSNVHQFCKKFFQIEKSMNREGQERSNGSVKIHMAYGGVLTKNRDGSMKHDLIHSRDSEVYKEVKAFAATKTTVICNN